MMLRSQNFIFIGFLATLLTFKHSIVNKTSSEKNFPEYLIKNSKQLIVVKTEDWDSVIGKLQCYERDNIDKSWHSYDISCEVNVGRNGLAWGIGLHDKNFMNTPLKHEGDGKSPAGIFRLQSVFGYAPADSTSFLKMPYIHLDSTCLCIDDTNSKYYNQILDSLTISQPDWKSFEKMKLNGNWYQWGIFVEHNYDPPEKNAGSCIYMHIWDGPKIPTSGCTSMDELNLLRIIRWLDTKDNPVLIQLPEAQYNMFKNEWGLP
jgi:D-alanyl-D-alanine dipeptidase